MQEATKRSIVRWIHLVLAIPIAGYIYSPFDQIQTTAPLLGLPSFLYLSVRDYGRGEAMSFDTFFEGIGPNQMLPRRGFL